MMAQFKEVPVTDLIPNDWNPNEVKSDEYNALVTSIKESGNTKDQAIIVREHPTEKNKYEIVDGEHRWQALQDAGIATAFILIEKLTDSEARMKTISMDKFRGEFDQILLGQLLKELRDDFNISEEELKAKLGYSSKDITEFISLVDFNWEEFDNVEIPDIEESYNLLREIDFSFTLAQLAIVNQTMVTYGKDNMLETLVHTCKKFTDYANTQIDSSIPISEKIASDKLVDSEIEVNF